MTNLESLLKRIEDAAGKALSRPWEAYYVFGSSDLPSCIQSSDQDKDGKTLEVCSVEDWYTEENRPTLNFKFIVEAANNIEKLVQIIRVQQEALEKTQGIGEQILAKYDMGDISAMTKDFSATHHLFLEHLQSLKRMDRALKEVERIAGDV